MTAFVRGRAELLLSGLDLSFDGPKPAREIVKALRQDVLAKCCGGDVTRRRKLLEKQKEGKKRMRRFGRVGRGVTRTTGAL